MRTASTIKLPIMAAVSAAVEAGKAKWDELLTLREEDKVSGPGVLREFSGGVRLPPRDVMRMVIVVSDNTATNLILDRIGTEYVNQQIDRMGMHQTRSMRRVLGDGSQLKRPAGFSKAGWLGENKRFGLGKSAPKEMVLLLEKPEGGEALSAGASKEMIAILKRQQHKDCIGRRTACHCPTGHESTRVKS